MKEGRDGGGLFLSLLGLLFIALKLTGRIDWSWWWVTAPIWGPLAFALIVLAICGVVIAVAAVAGRRRS